MKTLGTLIVAVAIALIVSSPAAAQDLSFFITTAGPGDGANLGDLAGADAHCQVFPPAAPAGRPGMRI
jgi:hypothetical protein